MIYAAFFLVFCLGWYCGRRTRSIPSKDKYQEWLDEFARR